MASTIVVRIVLGWLRNRRTRVRARRRERRQVDSLAAAFRELDDRVVEALDGLRADGAAWKLAASLQARVEKLETRQSTMHQEYLTAIEAAHETARSAVNSVKGAKGGRGNSAERAQLEQLGRDIDNALKTPEGRAELIAQVEALDDGQQHVNGRDRAGAGPLGDWTPGPS